MAAPRDPVQSVLGKGQDVTSGQTQGLSVTVDSTKTITGLLVTTSSPVAASSPGNGSLSPAAHLSPSKTGRASPFPVYSSLEEVKHKADAAEVGKPIAIVLFLEDSLPNRKLGGVITKKALEDEYQLFEDEYPERRIPIYYLEAERGDDALRILEDLLPHFKEGVLLNVLDNKVPGELQGAGLAEKIRKGLKPQYQNIKFITIGCTSDFDDNGRPLQFECADDLKDGKGKAMFKKPISLSNVVEVLEGLQEPMPYLHRRVNQSTASPATASLRPEGFLSSPKILTRSLQGFAPPQPLTVEISPTPEPREERMGQRDLVRMFASAGGALNRSATPVGRLSPIQDVAAAASTASTPLAESAGSASPTSTSSTSPKETSPPGSAAVEPVLEPITRSIPKLG